jgi:hypothetical protein
MKGMLGKEKEEQVANWSNKRALPKGAQGEWS